MDPPESEDIKISIAGGRRTGNADFVNILTESYQEEERLRFLLRKNSPC